MKNLTRNKKIILSSIIGVLIGTLLSISYAMYTYNRTGVTNQLVTGDIYMKYLEGSNLNLSGAMPSSSYPTATEHNYFQFQITGKNTHPTNDISYTLKLNHGDVPSGKATTNRIADKWLYFKLVEVNNNTETTLVNDANYNTIPNSVIYTTTIPHNTMSETTKTYRLYARIDNNLTIGNTAGANYSQSEWNNLFASIKINAEGTKVESTTPFINGTSETTLYAHWESSTYTIACPGEGCYYSWNSYGDTTWNTNGSTPKTIDPSNLPSGVSTNYNDVMRNSVFIAMKLNNSNQVEHAYICGVEKGTPFCIEGTYDNNPNKEKILQANADTFKSVFDSCQNNFTDCDSSSNNGSFYFFNDGQVGFATFGDGYCYVDSGGSFMCADAGNSPYY